MLAGLGIGCAETAESAAVAALARERLRGSAFGLLATVQAVGNLIVSAVAGLLWSAISPVAAFVFLAAAMVIVAALIAAAGKGRVPGARRDPTCNEPCGMCALPPSRCGRGHVVAEVDGDTDPVPVHRCDGRELGCPPPPAVVQPDADVP